MEELVSPSRARWTHGVINSVEDMEAVISSAVNHLIPCELSVRQNGGCIRAYHFLRSTLAHDSQSECKEKTGSSMQRIFETSVFDQVFAKLNTLISVYNLEGKKDDHLKLVTLSHAFGLISDLLGHSTADSAVIILQHLSNKWGNLGEIVKDTVKSLIFERGGMATNAQEVVIYEILRLWRCALKAQVKIDRTSQFSKITTPYSSAIDTLRACLSTYPREWTSEVRYGSAEIMLSPVIAQLFYRTLKTVYKLVTANDWLGFLRTRVDDLVFDVVTAPVDQNKKEEGELDVNPLILSLGRYAAKKDSGHDSDCDPLQPDHGLSLRLVLILALRLVASLDPSDPRALRLLRAVRTIVQVSQPHITPLVQGSQYEAAIVSLLSADDAHLFAGLDLWITIENKLVRMQGRELAEFIPNTDWLFAQFVSSIGFAPYLLVDWLVSPETSCLTYLVHYLRRFRTREDKRHFSATSGDEPSESHSETCAVDKHGVPSFPPFDQSEWPTEPIRSMLIQVSRCLSTLEANRNIAFSPLPLIRSINYVVSILPNRSVPIGQGVKC